MPSSTKGSSVKNDELDVPSSGIQVPSPPFIHDEEQIQNGVPAEDVMDISSSEVDEGEITDYSPEPPKSVDEGLIPEVDDTYEPPLAIDPVLLSASTSQPHQPVTGAPAPASPLVEPSGKQEDIEESHDLQPRSKSLEDTNESGEITAISRSQSAANDSDPDDYEPPEPATPVELPIMPLNHDNHSSEPSDTPQDPDVSSAVQSTVPNAAPGVQDQLGATCTASVDIDTPKVSAYHSSQC